MEALGASAEPYDEWVQKVKGHGGQMLVGRYLRRLLQDSAAVGSTADLRRRAGNEKAGGRASHSTKLGFLFCLGAASRDELSGQRFYVVPRDDLIASKRASGPPVDLEDVRLLEQSPLGEPSG